MNEWNECYIQIANSYKENISVFLKIILQPRIKEICFTG